MRFRSALLAATVLAVPFAAQGQGYTPGPVTGLYIGLGAGVNLKNQVQVKNLSETNTATGGVPVSNVDLNSSAGPVALGAIGWGFGNGLRVRARGRLPEQRLRRAEPHGGFCRGRGIVRGT